MKILAIGAAGFLGNYIVRGLIDEGHDVTVLDFKPEVPDLPDGASYRRGDVTNLDAMMTAMAEEKPEVVIDLAGLLTKLCASQPYKSMAVNTMGVANVLEAARLNGVKRVVISSSAGVCSPDRVDTREERPVSTQVSMYGATKFMCEILGREYRKNYGLEVVCLRYTLIYGPGEVATPGNAMRLKMIESCVDGRSVHIDDAYATDRFHLIYVKDAARAAILAATCPSALDLVYNISGVPADFMSFEDYAAILKKICPEAGEVSFSGQGTPVEYGMYLHDKARWDFGFIPEFTAELGLRVCAAQRLKK